MLIDVHFLDTETGERAVYLSDYEWFDNGPDDLAKDAIDFMYGEGNYACDCNRGNFFDRALGRSEGDHPCGDVRFRIEKIVERSTDNVIYEDSDYRT